MTTTAAPPRTRRRALVWVGIAVLVVVVGALGAWLTALGQFAQRAALDPDARAPQGARAIAEVLRDQGVAVDVVRELGEARDAVLDGRSTLVVSDLWLLEDDVIAGLADDAATTVLLAPDGRSLDLLFDGSSVAPASGGAAPVPAGCDLAGLRNAGEVAPGVLYRAAGDVTGCYGDDDGWGLLTADDGEATRYALDGASILANDRLAEDGNASLAAALLGGRERVVWYVPAADDPALATGETLGDATPDWVTPAIVLLAVAALVAMVWRGRRFGPLVAETLPVTVRASETTAGRARLYARSADALHAADQLRIAAAARLGRMLSLGPAATAEAIAAAVADRLGADPRAVRAVLLEDVPRTDRDLVDLAARLRHLEAAVRAAVSPAGPAAGPARPAPPATPGPTGRTRP